MSITRFNKLYCLIFTALSIATAAEVVHTVRHCSPGQVLVWTVQKAVGHKRHTTATLTKWAAWRKEHPDWKPKTTSETLTTFNWVCMDVQSAPEEQKIESDFTIPVLDAEPKSEDYPNIQSEVKATLTTEGRTGTANVPTGTNNPDEPSYGSLYPVGFGGWLGSGAPTGTPTQKHPEPPCPPKTPPVPEPSYLGVVLFGFAALIKFRNRSNGN